jgi:hypothetical protein
MPKLIENPADVVDALELFDRLKAQPQCRNRGITDVVLTLNDLRTKFTQHHLDPMLQDWEMTFARMGADTLNEMDKQNWALASAMPGKDEAFQAFAEFLIGKNTAYGDTPIRRWGELGTCIRIDSKVQRYTHLTEHPEDNRSNEPILDTIRDVVGYCVLGYRLALENNQ